MYFRKQSGTVHLFIVLKMGVVSENESLRELVVGILLAQVLYLLDLRGYIGAQEQSCWIINSGALECAWRGAGDH